MSRIVMLAGLPKAGKSLICGAIYHILRQYSKNFFLERLAPDCEGIWTWDSSNLELARKLKNELKSAGQFFSPAFVRFKCDSIRGLAKRFDLLILDLGGIPSPENELFIKTAKECGELILVLLRRKDSDIKQIEDWRNFLGKLEVKFIEIETDWKEDLKNEALKKGLEILQKLEVLS